MMRADSRRAALLDHLMQRGQAQVEELAALLGVSRMTVHRDLDLLSARRFIRKVRGGATVQPSVVFESDWGYRSQVQLAEKRALAEAAAQLLEPGMAVCLDDSTTTGALVPYLKATTPITVITYGLEPIQALASCDDVTLIGLGGTYDGRNNAFYGVLCEQGLATLSVNLAFMSTAGLREGYTYQHEERVVRVKRTMLDIAETKVLMFDHTKYGRSALHRCAELREFDRIFVTTALPATCYGDLRQHGVPVERVPVPEPAVPTNHRANDVITTRLSAGAAPDTM